MTNIASRTAENKQTQTAFERKKGKRKVKTTVCCSAIITILISTEPRTPRSMSLAKFGMTRNALRDFNRSVLTYLNFLSFFLFGTRVFFRGVHCIDMVDKSLA